MSTYADTSFLVSLYLTDVHTSEAERRMTYGPVMLLTSFHVAEWTHAVEQHVFRGAISRGEGNLYHQRFQENRESGSWIQAAMPESVFDVCTQLAQRYAARFGLRTLDTLHIASALELKAQRFWTFDNRQKKLARAVGLKTT